MMKSLGNDERSRRAIGFEGEEIAVDYLRKKGYRILERGYRTRYGEIDIIGIDGEVLAFIEVKLRRGRSCGIPGEAVDRRKQNQIAGMARHFLSTKRWEERVCRFDTVSICSSGKGDFEFELIKDAFRLDSF